MHRKKHRCEIILIQEFKNQYIEFLPIVFDRLDNFKLKIIECSIKLIKYVKDCTSDALKELHNHRVAIIKKINGLSDLNDIKKYTDDIKFHVSDQKYFDDINKETKRFFEIQFIPFLEIEEEKPSSPTKVFKGAKFVIIIKFRKVLKKTIINKHQTITPEDNLIVEIIQNPVEVKESKVEVEENKVEVNENRVEVNENKVEIIQNPIDTLDSKHEIIQNLRDILKNKGDSSILDLREDPHELEKISDSFDLVPIKILPQDKHEQNEDSKIIEVKTSNQECQESFSFKRSKSKSIDFENIKRNLSSDFDKNSDNYIEQNENHNDKHKRRLNEIRVRPSSVAQKRNEKIASNNFNDRKQTMANLVGIDDSDAPSRNNDTKRDLNTKKHDAESSINEKIQNGELKKIRNLRPSSGKNYLKYKEEEDINFLLYRQAIFKLNNAIKKIKLQRNNRMN